MKNVTLKMQKQGDYVFPVEAGYSYNLVVYVADVPDYRDLNPQNDYIVTANSLAAGRHTYTLAREGKIFQFGILEVEDILATAKSDPVSVLRARLEVVESKIAERIKVDQYQFTVEDHSITRELLSSLQKERNRIITELNAAIRRERASRGESVSFFKSIKVQGGK